MLLKNKSIETFFIRNNPIDNEGAKSFAAHLAKNEFVLQVKIDNSFISSKICNNIFDITCPRFLKYWSRGNFLLFRNKSNFFSNDKAMQKICEFLKNHPKLTEVHLDNCNLKDEDIFYLAKYLATDRRIKKLTLNGNKITIHGLFHLALMLEVNATLETLEAKNKDLKNSDLPSRLSESLNVNYSLINLELEGVPHFSNITTKNRNLALLAESEKIKNTFSSVSTPSPLILSRAFKNQYQFFNEKINIPQMLEICEFFAQHPELNVLTFNNAAIDSDAMHILTEYLEKNNNQFLVIAIHDRNKYLDQHVLKGLKESTNLAQYYSGHGIEGHTFFSSDCYFARKNTLMDRFVLVNNQFSKMTIINPHPAQAAKDKYLVEVCKNKKLTPEKRLELAQLALRNGANPNTIYSGCPFSFALEAAIKNNDLPLVKLLIQSGASRGVVHKNSLLTYAAQQNRWECLAELARDLSSVDIQDYLCVDESRAAYAAMPIHCKDLLPADLLNQFSQLFCFDARIADKKLLVQMANLGYLQATRKLIDVIRSQIANDDKYFFSKKKTCEQELHTYLKLAAMQGEKEDLAALKSFYNWNRQPNHFLYWLNQQLTSGNQKPCIVEAFVKECFASYHYCVSKADYEQAKDWLIYAEKYADNHTEKEEIAAARIKLEDLMQQAKLAQAQAQQRIAESEATLEQCHIMLDAEMFRREFAEAQKWVEITLKLDKTDKMALCVKCILKGMALRDEEKYVNSF